jgi:hypothetical protein
VNCTVCRRARKHLHMDAFAPGASVRARSPPAPLDMELITALLVCARWPPAPHSRRTRPTPKAALP